jgi:hypothetical protein
MDESPQYRPLYSQVYETWSADCRGCLEARARHCPPSRRWPRNSASARAPCARRSTRSRSTSLIDRRQGKGTYVAEHTQERSLFRFFRLTRPDGARAVPTSGEEVVKRRRASPTKRKALKPIADRSEIIRVRRIDDEPAVLERIIAAGARCSRISIEARAAAERALCAVPARVRHQHRLDRGGAARRRAAQGHASPGVRRARRCCTSSGSRCPSMVARVEWRVEPLRHHPLVYAVTLS